MHVCRCIYSGNLQDPAAQTPPPVRPLRSRKGQVRSVAMDIFTHHDCIKFTFSFGSETESQHLTDISRVADGHVNKLVVSSGREASHFLF